MKTAPKELRLITGYCKHCHEAIVRVPWKPDPNIHKWLWGWVHHNTGQPECNITEVAEPKR